MSEAETLPPSAGYVLDVLEREGETTLAALQQHTYLAESTAWDGLTTLEERDLVEREHRTPSETVWRLRDSE